MRSPVAVAVTCAAIAVTLSVCAPAADAVNGGCTAANTHHLTYAQRGGRITLLPGQCLQLRLETFTDGGAAWYTTRHASRAVVRVVSARVTPDKVPPGVVGGPSTTYLLYKRVGTGTTRLRLEQEQLGKARKGDEIFTLQVRGR